LVQRYTLSNGIRLVYDELPFLRSASIGVWIGTGSRDESSQLSGISHFLEHLFFKGTTKYHARQLAELFDQIGGQVNAYTTKEYTSLHVKVLDEHAELALTLLSEMLFDSIFAQDEMEREKSVIMEEIKMYEDNAEEAVHDWIVEKSFAGHPLGVNILGTEAHLRSFARQDVIDYMENRYTPDQMVISVAGRFDVQKLIYLVQEKFGHLQRTRKELVSGQPIYKQANIFDPRPIEQTHVCLALPGYAYSDPRIYALALLNHVLGASSSSLLFQEIREERGLAYSVFSYHSAFRDTGLFTIYYGCSPDQATDVMQLIQNIMDRLRRVGMAEGELQKAKIQLITSFWLSHESPASRIGRMAKNELYFGQQVEPEEAVAKMQEVTLGDVQMIIQELLSSPMSFVALGPKEHSFFANL
jgi:predicted Zn-dependent peptidase